MNKFEPKSIRYRGELQKPFTDCGSFPKVDFSKFDFPIKIIESPMDVRVEKEVFSAIKRVNVNVDKDELLRALNYERDQYAQGYQKGYCDCIANTQPKWISVVEREPELGVEVLTCDGYNNIHVAYRTSENLYYRDGVDGYLAYFSASYWMPLPEAPKEV